jgi:hypothetical protein
VQASDASPLSSPAGRHVGGRRILTGLLQGILLYLLCHAADLRAWPADAPLLFAPLFLAALFVPIVFISSLGNLDRRALLSWTLAAAVVLAGLGCWDGWRVADLPLGPAGHRPYPAIGLVFLAAAGLFIAHALVMAAVRDRRRIATYATYFDTAWTLGVQLAFSALFLGVTWLVLFLGAQLFELVKLDFLSRLLRKDWFWIPVTAFAFACGMHLTDVRPAIVRGIRNLLLTLMSWLLPVTVLLVGGFLLALPFTGLVPLWNTRHAASVLLCAAAALVVFVNAAWQDGDDAPPRVMRLAARLAAVLPAPLVLIAMYALALRVADHGWTGARVHAAASMLVATCYAAGYLAASLRRGWLALLARVNIATAFVVPLVILALGSPLLDPARIAVASQVGRLASGRIKADQFDFAFLRFDAVRFGRAALDRLEQANGPDAASVRAHIAAVRRMKTPWDGAKFDVPPPDLAVNMRIHPDGAAMPAGFLRTDWVAQEEKEHVPRWRYPACLLQAGKRCDAFILDIDADGRPEVLLMPEDSQSGVVFALDAHGAWRRFAGVNASGACGFRRALAAGKVTMVKPTVQDLEIGGVRVRIEPDVPDENCKQD